MLTLKFQSRWRVLGLCCLNQDFKFYRDFAPMGLLMKCSKAKNVYFNVLENYSKLFVIKSSLKCYTSVTFGVQNESATNPVTVRVHRRFSSGWYTHLRGGSLVTWTRVISPSIRRCKAKRYQRPFKRTGFKDLQDWMSLRLKTALIELPIQKTRVCKYFVKVVDVTPTGFAVVVYKRSTEMSPLRGWRGNRSKSGLETSPPSGGGGLMPKTLHTQKTIFPWLFAWPKANLT